MNLETKTKNVIGELNWTVIVLQTMLEAKDQEILDLKEQLSKKDKK